MLFLILLPQNHIQGTHVLKNYNHTLKCGSTTNMIMSSLVLCHDAP